MKFTVRSIELEGSCHDLTPIHPDLESATYAANVYADQIKGLPVHRIGRVVVIDQDGKERFERDLIFERLEKL